MHMHTWWVNYKLYDELVLHYEVYGVLVRAL